MMDSTPNWITHSQASIDRARGGQIKITLKIPSKTYAVQGGKGGQVTTDAMSVSFEIDLEEMPLVNVATYKTDRTQTGPATIPYPNGTKTYSESFA